jgi:hypothetical protein
VASPSLMGQNGMVVEHRMRLSPCSTQPSGRDIDYSTPRVLPCTQHISLSRTCRPWWGNLSSCAVLHSSHMLCSLCTGFLCGRFFLTLIALLQSALSVVSLALECLALPDKSLVCDCSTYFTLQGLVRPNGLLLENCSSKD